MAPSIIRIPIYTVTAVIAVCANCTQFTGKPRGGATNINPVRLC